MPNRKKQFVFPGAVRWPPVGQVTPGGGVGGPRIVMSNYSIAENAANGTTVGTLSVSGGSGSYTFSKVSDPDSKFTLTTATLTKAAALDYETATSHLVTFSASGTGNPPNAVIAIQVTNVLEVTLGALTIDDQTAEPGVAWSATITGKTSGSTITATSSDGTVLSVVSTTVSGTFTVEGTPNVTLHETHVDGSNSPRDSVIAVTVSDAETINAPVDVEAVEPVTNPPTFNMQSDFTAPGDVQAGDIPQTQFDSAGTIYSGTAVTILDDPPDFSGAGLPTLAAGDHTARFRYVRDEGGPGEVIGAWSTPADFEIVSAYDADAQAIFDEFTTPADDTRKGHINTLVLALKSASAWTILDRLFVYAAADSQAALVNWKNPGTSTGTVNNAPTFTADKGYTTNGSNSDVSMNFTASTDGVNYTQDSACFGSGSLTEGIQDATDQGADPFGSNKASLSMRGAFGGDFFAGRINNGGGDVIIVANTVGKARFAVNRSSSSSIQGYKNGSQIVIDNGINSTGLPATDMRVGSYGGAVYAARQYTHSFAGASMDGTKQAAFDAAIAAYLTAVGAT